MQRGERRRRQVVDDGSSRALQQRQKRTRHVERAEEVNGKEQYRKEFDAVSRHKKNDGVDARSRDATLNLLWRAKCQQCALCVKLMPKKANVRMALAPGSIQERSLLRSQLWTLRPGTRPARRLKLIELRFWRRRGRTFVSLSLKSDMTTLTNSIEFDSLMNLYHSGDYERALEAAERLREFGKVGASCCFYRASLLAQLGRLEEAETWFRRSIQLEKRGKRSLAITLSSLGNLLVQTRRYGEAERQFRKSIRLCPVRSSPYHGMARLCLVRGDDTAEAVDWAILALERQEQDLAASSTLRRLNLGECLGTLAWTVAAHWRKAPQVRRLVAQALEAVGTGTVESAALVHYHAGCAYRCVGETGGKRCALERGRTD
jgi:tetratricopeptide (TPR) repeat protein